MNCFEWHSKSSDYLDCTLVGTAKQDADRHLDECPECFERYRHYRTLLSTLATQPRSALPVQIRGTGDFAAPRTRRRPTFRSLFKRWQNLPFAVRVVTESCAIILLVIGGVNLAPRLTRISDQGLESTFEELLNFTKRDSTAEDGTTARKAPEPTLSLAPGETADDAFSHEDFADSEEGGDSEAEDAAPLPAAKAGQPNARSEVWRFSFKSVTLDELSGQIEKTLGEKYHASLRSRHGPKGLRVPGGIQFEFLLASAQVANLKTDLEALAPKGAVSGESNQPFSWFKSRPKNPLPAGWSSVVIWVSQL